MALVRLLRRVDDLMPAECRCLPEAFAADLADEGPGAGVHRHMPREVVVRVEHLAAFAALEALLFALIGRRRAGGGRGGGGGTGGGRANSRRVAPRIDTCLDRAFRLSSDLTKGSGRGGGILRGHTVHRHRCSRDTHQLAGVVHQRVLQELRTTQHRRRHVFLKRRFEILIRQAKMIEFIVIIQFAFGCLCVRFHNSRDAEVELCLCLRDGDVDVRAGCHLGGGFALRTEHSKHKSFSSVCTSQGVHKVEGSRGGLGANKPNDPACRRC